MLLQNYIYHTSHTIVQLHERPEQFDTEKKAVRWDVIYAGIKDLLDLAWRYCNFFDPYGTNPGELSARMHLLYRDCKDITTYGADTRNQQITKLVYAIATEIMPVIHKAEWYVGKRPMGNNVCVMHLLANDEYVATLKPFTTEKTPGKCPWVSKDQFTDVQDIARRALGELRITGDDAKISKGYEWKTVKGVPLANDFLDHILFEPVGNDFGQYMNATAGNLFLKWYTAAGSQKGDDHE